MSNETEVNTTLVLALRKKATTLKDADIIERAFRIGISLGTGGPCQP